MKKKKASFYALWGAKLIVAYILLQTLPFKFGAAPESVELFSKIGIEPRGRIGSGIVELIASIMLFIPKKTWIGAILAAGTMTGALLSHLLVLGFDSLAVMALIALVSSLYVLYRVKKNVPFFNA